MRRLQAAVFVAAAWIVASASAHAQASTAAPVPAVTGPAWADPANWNGIKPVETHDIVYANVPLIRNPSAEASQTPGSVRKPMPTTGAPGTMDVHLDVYQVPSTKPTPVLIQLHGGGWIVGDRPRSYNNTFEPFFVAGASIVTVQYRNAIDAPAPASVQDVRCAMAWVRANARKYNFDLDRVVMWGGSAGAHLALMAAYAPASFNPPGCTDQPKVAAVLDDYGPTDLVDSLTFHGSVDITHQWIGMDLPLPPDPPAAGAPAGRPAQPHWPAPTPAMLARAKEVSPVTYIHPGLPPTFIVNGDKDGGVNPAESAELKALLDAAHVPDGRYIVPGGGHGNFPPAEAEKAMLLSLQFLQANGVIQ
jgi:acetyl esterase/lipase